MGWTFQYSIGTIAQLVKERLEPQLFTRNGKDIHTKVIAHSRRGNTLYSVVEHTTIHDRTAKTTKRFIAVDLLAKDRSGSVGYKGLTESMGPSQCDCPLYLLDLVPEPTWQFDGPTWRERVRAWHKGQREKKAAPAMDIGQRWELKEGLKGADGTKLHTVKILSATKGRRSIHGTCNDGNIYRIPKKWLVRPLMSKEVTAQQFMEEVGMKV